MTDRPPTSPPLPALPRILVAADGPGLPARSRPPCPPRRSPAPQPVFRPGLTRQPDRRHRHPRLDHLTDHRNHTPDPPPDVVARHVRAEFRKHSDTGQQDTSRITEIVVTEIIQTARSPR